MALAYGSPRDTIRAFGFRSKAGVGARSIDGDDLGLLAALAYATYGVIRGFEDEMEVVASSGLTVEVGTGAAIVGTRSHPHPVRIDNGASGSDTTTLTIAAGGAAARVDTVAIRVQDDGATSQADVVVLQGTRASAVTQTDTDFYFPLAEVNVGASASAIVARDITPLVDRFASLPQTENVGLNQIQTLLLRTSFTLANVRGLMTNDKLFTQNATKVWVLVGSTLHEYINLAGDWSEDVTARRTVTGVGSRPILLPYYNSRDDELLAIVVGFSPTRTLQPLAGAGVAATPVIKAHIVEAASAGRVTTGSNELTGTWSGNDNTNPFIAAQGVQSLNGTNYWVTGSASRQDLASQSGNTTLDNPAKDHDVAPLGQYSIIAAGSDVIIREIGLRKSVRVGAGNRAGTYATWTVPVIAPSDDNDAILTSWIRGSTHDTNGLVTAITWTPPTIRKLNGTTGDRVGTTDQPLPSFEGGQALGPYSYDPPSGADNTNAFYSPTILTRVAGLLCWLGFANGKVFTKVVTGIESVADFYPYKGQGQ